MPEPLSNPWRTWDRHRWARLQATGGSSDERAERQRRDPPQRGKENARAAVTPPRDTAPMTATQQEDRRNRRSASPRPAARASSAAHPPATRGWSPLSGDALLDRLRYTGQPRPMADPVRIARLMAILDSAWTGSARDGAPEDAVERAGVRGGRGSALDPASSSPEAIGSDRRNPTTVRRPPLSLTSERLSHVLAGDRGDSGVVRDLHRSPTAAGACGALVHALFRQLVTVGSIDHPMDDGLSALEVDEHGRRLCQWIASLPAAERSELAAEVTRQAHNLVSRWPRLDPTWLPRAKEYLRIALPGGAAELSGSVDLAVGRPGLDVASVALVGISSGVRHPEHRRALHFAALIETLRHPSPPFAVAAYYTRTGEIDVDPVTDDLLDTVAFRVAAGLRILLFPDGEVGTGANGVVPAPHGLSRGYEREPVDGYPTVDAHRCLAIRGTRAGTHR